MLFFAILLADAISNAGMIPELRRNLSKLKILMFGMDCDEEKFLIAVEQGVSGYILKDASASEVAAAIRAAGGGYSLSVHQSYALHFSTM